MRRPVLALILTTWVLSCGKKDSAASTPTPVPAVIPSSADTAIFAGGCFWCMEGPFERMDGVYAAVSGYTGGHKDRPTYEEVGGGQTGHRESVMIVFDPARVSYEKLLDVFWRQINPTDDGGQFADRGFQYTTAIFYRSEQQKRLAQSSKNALGQSGRFHKPIVTPLLPASTFYPAEEYHQDYYKKNTEHYLAYRRGSGREAFLKETWGDHGAH